MKVYFTGTLMTPDGTDTNCYGEPCLEGHGYTMDIGWVDPDWSLWEVQPDREDVRPDCMDADDDEQTPAEWLADVLDKRLHGVWLEWDGRDVIYDSEEHRNEATGESLMMAAHPQGFTARQIDEALTLLRTKYQRIS